MIRLLQRTYTPALAFLSVLTGLTFILSFYTKMFPVELFEIKLVEAGVSGWSQAPFFARILLAVELFTGVVFILNLRTGRWFYLFSIALLVVFIIYLLMQLIINGNEGDCGCFNNFIHMTPAEGIFKNILLIGVILLLYRYYQGIRTRYSKKIVILVLILAFALPFILNPVASAGAPVSYGQNDKLPLEPLYEGNRDSIPSKELRKGKWVVAYLSLTCPHCKTAAYKMQVMKNKNPSLPIYFFLNGKEFHLEKFLEESHLVSIPYMRLKGSQFIKMSGFSLPAIFMIEDQIIYKKPDYVQLNQKEIEEWMEKE